MKEGNRMEEGNRMARGNRMTCSRLSCYAINCSYAIKHCLFKLRYFLDLTFLARV